MASEDEVRLVQEEASTLWQLPQYGLAHHMFPPCITEVSVFSFNFYNAFAVSLTRKTPSKSKPPNTAVEHAAGGWKTVVNGPITVRSHGKDGEEEDEEDEEDEKKEEEKEDDDDADADADADNDADGKGDEAENDDDGDTGGDIFDIRGITLSKMKKDVQLIVKSESQVDLSLLVF